MKLQKTQAKLVKVLKAISSKKKLDEEKLGMFIYNLSIKGFRCFSEAFCIDFNSGLNVLVGENGSGKTAVISALRQLFIDSESGRYFVTERDFYKGFIDDSQPAESFSIKASFEGLGISEKIAFLPWCDLTGKAILNLHVDNKEKRNYFKRLLWGGKSKLSAFESETIDLIHCIYLPPLRDAEAKLTDGRQSRLSKLLKALSKKELIESRSKKEPHPLEKRVAEFNEELTKSDDFPIKQANKLIAENLKKAVGQHFSQSTLIQFSENNFARIVEGLRLLFFPDINNKDPALFRSLQENSLGYNNLLYIASILAELIADEETKEEKDSYFKLLLIEEPEAHLHPQLQIRLLNYLADVAKRANVQVIVTTHSTVLASSVSIDSIIHLANQGQPVATSLVNCGLPQPSKNFINRWLDVTKSNLLFARGLILVEGIAEAIILPELAKVILSEHESLDDFGVSIINLNGIYFKHFMQLFCNLKDEGGEMVEGINIPVRCAGLTDRDPKKKDRPHYKDKKEGKNHALKLIDVIEESEYVRLYANELKTFEYDLAMEGNNAQWMAQVLFDNWHNDGDVKEEIKAIKDNDWSEVEQFEKAEVAYKILRRIDDSNMGKGLYAQLLADELSKKTIELEVPKYIVDAIHWACSIETKDKND